MRRTNVQYAPVTRRRDPAKNSLDLMHAALEDGLRTLIHAAPRSTRSARAWREEMAWLLSRDREEPFSFERLCEALDIDAERLRRRTLTAIRGPAHDGGPYSFGAPRGTRP